MKKPLAIQLSILEPCTQGWDAMQAVQGGRHCIECKKVVVDFTRMTDGQLLDYFRKNEGGCGRFSSEQLEREIKEVIVPRRNWWARIAAGILLLMGLSKNADAQRQNEKVGVEQHAVGSEAQKQSAIEDSTVPGIYGTLIDDTNFPVINALVEVSKGGIVIAKDVTDFDGNYSISPLETGVYNVKFSFRGVVLFIEAASTRKNTGKVTTRVESCDSANRKTVRVVAKNHITAGLITRSVIIEKMPDPGTKTISGDELPHSFKIEDLEMNH